MKAGDLHLLCSPAICRKNAKSKERGANRDALRSMKTIAATKLSGCAAG